MKLAALKNRFNDVEGQEEQVCREVCMKVLITNSRGSMDSVTRAL